MARRFGQQSAAFAAAPATVKTELGHDISRQIYRFDGGLMWAGEWFDEGAVSEVHAHPHTWSTSIESGVFQVFMNGTSQVLSAAHGHSVEPNFDYSVVCLQKCDRGYLQSGAGRLIGSRE